MRLIDDGEPDYNSGDLISRSALKQMLPAPIEDEYKRVHQIIDNAPTVEPERPQGKWIVEKNRFGDILHCSICGARPRRSEYGYDLHDNFCNDCGADMRKGDTE